MTRAVLDTSAYSAFMRGHSDINLAIQEAEAIYVTPVILGELLAGFMSGTRRKKNEQELKIFLSSPRVNIVDLDGETAERYAVTVNALRAAGTPLPTNDIWIAASAMQYGLHVLTTDAHYKKVSQIIVDYFDP